MSTQEILPTDSELEILQILWQHGASTVRFVNDTINQHREVGYTSTLKTMQLMLDKDMLSRTIEDRIHYYIAAINEQHTQAGLLDEFVENTFRGSTSSLVLSMLGNSEKTSYEDIQKIKELIREIEQKNFNNSSNS
jgi:BlaI family transcriptional regulator, penicillinase repressor